VVKLTAFPLTPNGKLDKRALPEPELVRSDEQKYVKPTTPIEEILVGIWSKVLGREQIGIHDNFFDLGGDSILSLLIAARAKREGLSVSVQQMFRYQTIAGLAEQAEKEAVEMHTARQAVTEAEVALTPIQRWFFEKQLAEPWHWNQSILLKAPAGIDEETVEAALKQLLNRHDALRLRFRRDSEGQWRQVYGEWHDGGSVLEREDLRGLDQSEQTGALEQAADRMQRSLNLETGPVLRAVWFDLGAGGRRLLLILHHLVVDGVSWRILLEDFQELCQTQREFVIPQLGSSYGQWAKALVDYAGSEALQKELSYWERIGSHEVKPLRRDDAEGDNCVDSASRLQMRLTEEQTRALLQEAPRAYRTQI